MSSGLRRCVMLVLAALLVSLGNPSLLFAAEGGELPRIVNFAILATILVLVLRKPLADFLNAKTTQIREELQQARSRQTNAEVERRRAEELLASLDQEVQKARAELDSSRDEAQNQLNRAKKELAEASDRAVRELEGQADALARSLASRILGRDVA